MNEIDFEPGFMRIKVSRGAKAYTVGELGTKESPIECIILSVNSRRGLWPPDQSISKEQLGKALGLPPDAEKIKQYNAKAVEDWRSNRPLCGADSSTAGKGVLPKILDAEAPALVGDFLEYPQAADFVCAKCRWNEFSTDFKGTQGKACKESRMLLLYDPEDDMVATLSVPPTSIGAWRRYKTSLPRQNFARVWTSISTRPSEGGWEYNLIEFAPVKHKGTIVYVEREHVAPLGVTVNYQGSSVPKIKAYISEFRRIPLEDAEDYHEDSEIDDEDSGSDIPFEDSGSEF
jgi:hypothetical protein